MSSSLVAVAVGWGAVAEDDEGWGAVVGGSGWETTAVEVVVVGGWEAAAADDEGWETIAVKLTGWNPAADEEGWGEGDGRTSCGGDCETAVVVACVQSPAVTGDWGVPLGVDGGVLEGVLTGDDRLAAVVGDGGEYLGVDGGELEGDLGGDPQSEEEE